MPKNNTCCFTGHRVVGKDFNADLLNEIIIDLIKKGVDTFICGGAIGFDTIAEQQIINLKKTYPNIKLHLYIPCNNQTEKWSFMQKLTYKSILSKADFIDMPNKPYFDGCMKIRNYKMVDASSYCITYYNGEFAGGTAQTVRYAKKCGLKVINVYGGKKVE